jgi:hypothetical protein
MQRAQSARDFIVRSNSERHLRWERSIDNMRTTKDTEKNLTLHNGIEKCLKTQKKLAVFGRKMSSKLSEKIENHEERIERHHSLLEIVNTKRQEDNAALNRKFREISLRKEERL